MKNHISNLFLNRAWVLFVLITVWLIGVFGLYFFYHQQSASYQNTMYGQINQRVSMSSVLQAELIDKEFSFLATNLKQLGLLATDFPEQLPTFATQLKMLNPGIWHIYIADEKGNIVFTTKQGDQPSIALRDYFIEHTKNDLKTFYISSPKQSVIQESELYIAMSYPLRDIEQLLTGVAVVTLKSNDLKQLLGNVSQNDNISTILTDRHGKLLWSSEVQHDGQGEDIYSLCHDNEFHTSTTLGIHRIKLHDNAQCDAQFLEKWGLLSIVAENRMDADAAIQHYHQELAKRNSIILFVLSVLLWILGQQLLKQIESRKLLAILNRRNKAIIDAMPDLLLTIRVDGKIIDHEVEDSFPLILPSEQLNGVNIKDIMEPELVERKLALIAQTIQTGEPTTIEYPLMVADKEYYFLERLTVLDEKHVLAFIIDITSRREAESRLEWQAFHDGLTGLANRLMFFEFLNKLIQDYRRNKREFTILFIDLNGFKAINDNYGHHAGDEVLKHVANQLRHVLRQTDTVARLGGDEFAILLPETSAEQAKRVVNSIKACVQHPLDYHGHQLIVTASIGLASCPQDATSADELVNVADKHMYEIKLTDR